MARRYVPKTYNNRRFLRFIAGGIITLALAFVILFLILFFVFQSYVVDGQMYIPWLMDEPPPPIDTPEPIATPTPPPTEEPEEESEEEENEEEEGEETPESTERYTIEQIQTALEPQFMATALGGRNPQVVFIEEVELDRNSIQVTSAELGTQTVDLTDSMRFKVEIRFEQPVDEFNIWEEINRNVEDKSYRRDGRNHTISTYFYYFNDEEGEPVLAFIEE